MISPSAILANIYEFAKYTPLPTVRLTRSPPSTSTQDPHLRIDTAINSVIFVASPGRSPQSAWLLSDLRVIAIGAFLITLWDLSGLDLAAVRMFGTASGFALKDAFIPRELLHEGGRWISIALFVFVLVNALRPLLPATNLPRAQRWVWLSVIVLCLALISSMKMVSLTSCPWDLAEFGGIAQYVSHWQTSVADGGAGRCFPAGHPSGAFGFFAGYFALRPWNQHAARFWLSSVVGLGILFGAAQLVRGAHYPSHTLYTAFLCWTLSAMLYQVVGFLCNRASMPHTTP